jgi:hypothetical protein
MPEVFPFLFNNNGLGMPSEVTYILQFASFFINLCNFFLICVYFA